MKKILTIMAVLFCLGISANAQLNVKKSSTLNKVALVRNGDVQLYEGADRYYLAIRSSNQFDKAFILSLGEGKSSAFQTITDLQSLSETISENESITIDNRGKDVRIRKRGEDAISFSTDGFAGTMFLKKAEIVELITALSE